VNERFTPASWAGDITAVGFLAASLAMIRMRDEDEFRPAVSARYPVIRHTSAIGAVTQLDGLRDDVDHGAVAERRVGSGTSLASPNIRRCRAWRRPPARQPP
jgi:hypothetical protein